MNITQAFKAIENGKSVKHKFWRDKEIYLTAIKIPHGKLMPFWIAVCHNGDILSAYIPTQQDIYFHAWELI